MADSLPSENSSDMSSSTQETEPAAPTSTDGDAPHNYAFYVHSKKTLTEDLPPKVDSKVYVRQRRRRTRYVRASLFYFYHRLLFGPDVNTGSGSDNQLGFFSFSPEDHAILEAEYQQNPKPDKLTRASIVSRVSLGDKEVQV